MSDPEPSSAPRPFGRFIKIALSLALLSGTAMIVGAKSVVARLHGLDGGWLGIAFGITVLQFALLGARWWFLARRLGLELSYRRALAEYYLSTLVNSVLPFGPVGDALRALRHADRTRRTSPEPALSRIFLAIVLERASGQIALWLVVLLVAPSLWRTLSWPPGSRPSMLVVVAMFLGAGLAAFFAWRFGRRFVARLRDAAAAGGRVLFSPANMAVHLPLSFLLLASHVALFVVAAHALGFDLSLAPAIRMMPPILAASSVPAFIGGFGVREATAAGLYYLTGLDAADGAAISFIYGTVSLLASTPGILALSWRQR